MDCMHFFAFIKRKKNRRETIFTCSKCLTQFKSLKYDRPDTIIERESINVDAPYYYKERRVEKL